jgi:hypothetical protein
MIRPCGSCEMLADSRKRTLELVSDLPDEQMIGNV